MIGGAAALLAESHANVPSEAVGSGLGVWWVLVAVLGLLTVACATGFVVYLRRTSPRSTESVAHRQSESSAARSESAAS